MTSLLRMVGTALLLSALMVNVPGPAASAQATTRTAGFRLIVNPANPSSSVDRRFVVDAFLKKVTTWPGGLVIRPADLRRDSPVRGRFTEELLDRSASAVRCYWQHLIFSGRGLPPPEMESEDEVVRFVLRQTGAVGYVSEGTDLRGAKVLAVR